MFGFTRTCLYHPCNLGFERVAIVLSLQSWELENGYNLILINGLRNMWVGNVFSNMETRNLTGWKDWVRFGFCHVMAADVGGSGLCSSLLDSKDRFSEHVTGLTAHPRGLYGMTWLTN
ncbi:hypothetical protein BDA96_06G052300 [Sorghum bicolor]|uniref:Uncharacterized protein n=1 Tax=Sorghum bicolor TaxID=4558 RepID=A0A921UBH6_SORBI|nr:hypothetical protein BDA96_06G052300 [Sorghum bicolor]